MRYRDGAVRPSPLGLPAPDRDLRAGRMEHQSLVSEPDASTRRSTAMLLWIVKGQLATVLADQ